MAHQPGWIELYTILDAGGTPDPGLLEQCKASRTGIGETMLHWYALEGSPEVLERLIALGFAVDVINEFGQSPLLEASIIDRWDNAAVLIRHGARFDAVDDRVGDYLTELRDRGKKIPTAIRALIRQRGIQSTGIPSSSITTPNVKPHKGAPSRRMQG